MKLTSLQGSLLVHVEQSLTSTKYSLSGHPIGH